MKRRQPANAFSERAARLLARPYALELESQPASAARCGDAVVEPRAAS